MKMLNRIPLLGLAFGVVGSLHAADADLIKKGEYLATAGDCVACHTAPGGAPFAGGLKLPTPIGDIVATNITPSKTAGIGNYTLEQFRAAMRLGKRADGANLYPAMPYTSYSQVSDADIEAMYAYFMQGVQPVDKPAPATELPFPFNIRLSMNVWNALFHDSKPYQAESGQSEEWNRGAYLVKGLTHCSTCHSPRNLAMAESSGKALAGGEVGAWYAPNITSDPHSGIGDWSHAELVQYLKTGRVADKAQAAGPMAEAIDHSLQYLSDADLNAIATYLRSVAPISDPAQTTSAAAQGKAYDELSSIRGQTLPADPDKWSGQQLYDAYCATCHQAQGQGSPGGGMPSLFNNTATGHVNAANLTMVILEGIKHGPHADEVSMPGFAEHLSNKQVSTLANYVLNHYGNAAAKVDEAAVRDARAGGKPSNLVGMARAAMGLGAIVILLAAFGWVNRRKRHG